MPTIDQQNALTAAEITDKPDIRFGVSNLQGATPASNQMSLPELGKAIGSVINKDTVADMLALTGVPDGTRVDTARYSTSHTVGDGSGGEYVYDADSTATIDGGFVMPGVGGSLSFKQQWRTLSSQTNSTTVVLDAASSSIDDDYNGDGVAFQLPEVTGTAQSGNGTSFVLASGEPATDDYYNDRDIVVIWPTVGGTAQAGSTTTITLEAGASATDDFYTGRELWINDGTSIGVRRTISDYDGTTKVATVSEAFVTTPDNTSVYSIRSARQRYTVDDYVGASKTVTLSESLIYLVDTTTTYSLTKFMIGSKVSDYVGSTRTATVSSIPCVLPVGTLYSVGTKIVDVAFDAGTSGKEFNATDHPFADGDYVYLLTDGGLPTECFHKRYIVDNATANTFELRVPGDADGTTITLTANGTGRLRAYAPVRVATHDGDAGVGRWLVKDTTIAKAMQFGAFTNEADSTIQLLNMLTATKNNGTWKVEITGGYYATKQPLDFERTHGLELLLGGGANFYDADLSYTSFPRGSGVVVWDGPAYGNVVNFENGYCEVPYMQLQANTTSTSSNAAKYGAVVRKTSGIGVGKFNFGRVVLDGFSVGVEFGDTSNADESTFNYVEFKSCDVGLQLNDEQCIGYYINYLRIYYSNVGIRVAGGATTTGGGGGVRIGHVFVAGEHVKILDIVAGATTSNNNGDFDIESVKIDGNTKTVQVVDTNNRTTLGKSIKIGQFRLASPVTSTVDTEPLFDISGGTRLMLYNGYLLRGNVLKLTGNATEAFRRPTALLDNCTFQNTVSSIESLEWLEVDEEIDGWVVDGAYSYADGVSVKMLRSGKFGNAYKASDREAGEDYVISNDLDFETGDYDNKRLDVRGATTISLSAERKKLYRVNADSTGDYALVLNGSPDYINCNYTPPGTNGTVYFEMTGDAFFVEARTGTAVGNYWFASTSGSSTSISWRDDNNVDTTKIYSNLDTSAWNSYAFTFEATSANIFVNGDNFNAFTIPNTSASNKLYFNRSIANQYKTGVKIRRFVVYETALSLADIQTLHSGGTVAGAVIDYRLDDNSSTLANNGSGGTGTLTGGTWEPSAVTWDEANLDFPLAKPHWVPGSQYEFAWNGTKFKCLTPGNRKENVDSITFAANIDIDFRSGTGDIKTIGPITEALTIDSLTATRVGYYTIVFTQDSTGHSVTLPTLYTSSPTISSTGDAVTRIRLFWDGTNWHDAT